MNIGWIGVGNIGLPMARHVLQAGHDLTINDLNRDAAEPLLEIGAKWADASNSS